MFNATINALALKSPLFSIDFYKVGHKDMEPDGTTLNYVNMTPRSDKYAPVKREFYDNLLVVEGVQARLIRLHERFQNAFFNRDVEEVIAEYKDVVDNALFSDVNMDHMRALHKLGYLPMEFRALPEGTLVSMNVPVLVMWNTHPGFSWLPTYLETDLSHMWKEMTNATIARNYRMIFQKYHDLTGTDGSFIPWQGHDFSARGLDNDVACGFSGMSHLTSFLGTDTVMAIPYAKYYYGADNKTHFVGHSVRASEHSVTCMGGEENELETFRSWMKKFPDGILSLVSDTWDFWDMVSNKLPSIKEDIMARNGKVVIRPDSGDPVKIITGYMLDEYEAEVDISGNTRYFDIENGRELTREEVVGAVGILSEGFGFTTNESGYNTLDSHIGLIYGDSITPERAALILDRLRRKGFAADNVVFGIGSYTYQMNSRDSFGFALKSTFCVVNGKKRAIQKKPKTGDGMKTSAVGALRVAGESGNYKLEQNVEFSEDYDSGKLQVVLRDGLFHNLTTLSEKRMRLWGWDDRKA